MYVMIGTSARALILLLLYDLVKAADKLTLRGNFPIVL